ncbi:hypothetical protein GCM10009837_17780 [Streptomyces durmitorensis]
MRNGLAEQPVPRGMEGDFVDAIPIAVMGVQNGRILIGEHSPFLRLGRSRRAPEFGELLTSGTEKGGIEMPFDSLCESAV